MEAANTQSGAAHNTNSNTTQESGSNHTQTKYTTQNQEPSGTTHKVASAAQQLSGTTTNGSHGSDTGKLYRTTKYYRLPGTEQVTVDPNKEQANV
ncbi:MAG: hypothetical protein S4CHLAM20_12150 [Chlamydiia bacterium]|nr:hypothetical protein [Chlamydiia bacterium]